MNDISVAAFGLYLEIVLFAYDVDEYADDDSNDEKNDEKHKRLFWNHCEHDEGLVSRGRYHHGYKCSEAEHSVGVQRYCSKPAHASGNRTKKGSDDHLTNLSLSQSFEYHTFGFDVKRLDHHHHDDDQSCNQYRIPKYVNEKMHYSR